LCRWCLKLLAELQLTMLSGREFQWGITSMKKEYRWAIYKYQGWQVCKTWTH